MLLRRHKKEPKEIEIPKKEVKVDKKKGDK